MFPDWRGETVYVVASGQSATSVRIPRAGCRVVVINRSYELAPWADVLYAADMGFWSHYAGARAFAGLKFCPDHRIRSVCPDAVPVEIQTHRMGRVDKMVRGPVGVIGGGGNSGFQAVNLAVQFGAARIYLVGLDYGGMHWHEDHPAALRNPVKKQLEFWAKVLDSQAETLESWGVDIINLSAASALRRFRYVDPASI